MTPAGQIAAAIELLAAIDATPARPADGTANDYFRARRFIGSSDRRAISDRVWRVFRTHRRLVWWLADKPTPRLLVAASLLLDGSGLVDVESTFTGGRFAPAPLAPSEQLALRRLQGRTLDHASMPEAVRLEMPDWLLPLLSSRFDAAELTTLLEPAPLDLRVNLLKTTREEAAAALATEGLEATPTPFSPWGLRIEGRRQVTTGPAFRAGLIEIQDEGSQLVAALTGARPGLRVADLCAGAGGKTLALAMMMQNRGQLVACDVSAARLDAAVRRLRRAGVHNVERHLIEAGDKWAKRRAGSFDRVLVDAPCTGTGTWRRNPDARLRLTEADLAELVPKQAAIMDQAATLVRTGGRLVYATCSLLSEENEDQVIAFLTRHPGFALVPLARAWQGGAPPNPGDFLSLTPARHGTDGFFAAVLERRA
ncbi:MAG TPA: RsmB/NOP family class I SAM-dependent RNA methyltransferase [Acetobacteraceae bacterium]|nr:RsmB/NOP family class I SAM-dependent RNA methyltransferase [Acetobacteraceae bacterium]